MSSLTNVPAVAVISCSDNNSNFQHASPLCRRRTCPSMPLYKLDLLKHESTETKEVDQLSMLNPPGEDVTQIIPNLFLGNGVTAIDQKFLHVNNVKLIINCASDCHTPDFVGKTDTFTYVHFKIIDHSDAPIKNHITDALIFINNTMSREEGVLVHCKAGISRSATFIIAYLMQYGPNVKQPHKIPYLDAFMLVKQLRPLISPNFGFCMVLRELNRENGFEIEGEIMVPVLEH